MTSAPASTGASLARDVGAGATAGVVSGTLGVGGGIILVPFLVITAHWQQKRAQATALVLVAMAALAGVMTYAYAGWVAFAPAGIITVGGLVGALGGSAVVKRVHNHWLQVAFGILLALVAVRLLWPTGEAPENLDNVPPLTVSLIAIYLASGLAMGFLSALFGIGGGILLVPILVTILDYDQRLAAGTSLAVMVPIALVGALRLTRPGFTDWRIGARLGIGGVIGGLVGARLGLVLPTEILTVAFALLLVVVSVRMVITGWRSRDVVPADTDT